MLGLIRRLLGFGGPRRQHNMENSLLQSNKTLQEGLHAMEKTLDKKFTSIMLNYDLFGDQNEPITEEEYELFCKPSFEYLIDICFHYNGKYKEIIDKFISQIEPLETIKITRNCITGENWYSNSILSEHFYDSFYNYYVNSSTSYSEYRLELSILRQLNAISYLIFAFSKKINLQRFKTVPFFFQHNLVFDMSLIYILDKAKCVCKENLGFENKTHEITRDTAKMSYFKEQKSWFKNLFIKACTMATNKNSEVFFKKLPVIIEKIEDLLTQSSSSDKMLVDAVNFLKAYQEISALLKSESMTPIFQKSKFNIDSIILKKIKVNLEQIHVFFINFMCLDPNITMKNAIKPINSSFENKMFWYYITNHLSELKDVVSEIGLTHENFKYYFIIQIINIITGFSDLKIYEKYDWIRKPPFLFNISILKEKFQILSSSDFKEILLCDRTFKICHEFLYGSYYPKDEKMRIKDLLHSNEMDKIMFLNFIQYMGDIDMRSHIPSNYYSTPIETDIMFS